MRYRAGQLMSVFLWFVVAAMAVKLFLAFPLWEKILAVVNALLLIAIIRAQRKIPTSIRLYRADADVTDEQLLDRGVEELNKRQKDLGACIRRGADIADPDGRPRTGQGPATNCPSGTQNHPRAWRSMPATRNSSTTEKS